ncbi:MAG: PAS domain S-box protein [Bryobacterales bacterium]|nr:PAS domain S-box protein [Bryobacterales bacterium]
MVGKTAEIERREELSQRVARLEAELLRAKAELASISAPGENPCVPPVSRPEQDVYFSLFEAMKEGCQLSEIICDGAGTPVDWRFLAVNRAYEEMTGKSREDVVGRRYREVFPDSDCDHWVRFFGEVALTGERRQFETTDRGRQWQTVAYSPVRGQFAAILNDVTERRHAEQALRESEHEQRTQREFLQALLAHAPYGVVVFSGRDLKLTSVNPAYAAMVGMTRDELLGRSYRERFPEAAAVGGEQRLLHVLETGEPWKVERHNAPVPGRPNARWEGHVVRLPEPLDGEPQLLALLWDVTNRVEAEERLQYVLHGIDVGVWDWDVARDEVVFSSRWQEMLGYTEHSPVWPAREWMELVHPEDLRAAVEAVRDHLDGRTAAYTSEIRVRHANGDWRWVLDRGIGIRDEQGAVYRVVGSHTDITDRRVAEQALRDSEERYRLMVEASPVGYLLGNVDGSIRDANEALLRMIGYTKADLGTLRWDNITPPEWLPVDEQHIAEARERGVCTPYEKEYWHRDGHRVPLLVGYALLGPERTQSAAFIVDMTELKEAETELRVSRERLQLAQAAAGFGTWEWDLVTGKTVFSDSCFALHGIRPHQDFTYSDWLACIDPQDAERIDQEIQNAIRGEGMYDAEFQVLRPDGSIRWLNGRGHVVRNARGEPIRMTCVSLDVTERRHTEQERQKLAAIIEQATDTIGLREAGGKPIYLNPSGRRLLGIADDADLRQYGALDYFLPEDREWVENKVFPMVLTEGAWQGKFRYRHQVSGAVVPVEMNMFTVREATSGELIGLATVSRDISERMRMEDALRKSEHYFRQLAESVPDIVFTSEPDGTVDYFNTRWCTYTGQSEGDGRAWGWSGVLHPEDVSRTLDRWNRSLTTGADYEIEYRLRGVHGTYRWFLGRARALRGADGTVQKWFGSCTDIDEQKFTEQALRRSNEQLQQFAYVATHDLQEPLRTISSFTQLLQRERDRGPAAPLEQYTNWVVEAANRMSNLVRDLLAYTLAAAQNEGYREPVALELLLVPVLESLKEEVRAANAQITHDVLPVLTVDRAQFEEVFRNLIGNALKFAKPGEPARIHISARFEPGAWLFSVEDNGIGFNAAHAERIFGVFKRLHGREVQGTGIGLAICKAIIERHGGRIWAQSRPGQGSTFWFTLPSRSENR